jgi:U5 small nuclear ribonucleoprotein component
MVNTEAIIRHALQEAIPITLVVNKIDRLILELRLPPADAFYKIKHTIEDINTYIRLVYSIHFEATTELVTAVSTQVRISV